MPMLAGVPVAAPRFTGREAELAGLTGALTVPGAVVLVEGELGIGKSRLVSEYLATDAGRAARPVVACCPPYRQPQTLGPVADALRQAADDIGGLGLSDLAGALRPLFPEWAHVLPAAPGPVEDATAARSRLFRALAELLGLLGAGLLVVEDAHWADEATLEFLLFLASRPPAAGSPPGVLVTVRPEDVPARSLLPRLARLAAGGRGLRLALGPLGQAGTAALVSSMLGTEQVTEGFTAFLHEQAGGVPLAVEESVRLLAARADLTRRDGRWVRRRLPKLAVPPTIRDSVLERCARLTADAQEVLSAAGVLAGPAREEMIAAVAGLDPDRARSGMSEALGCALLIEDERGLVSFRHPLGCQAVYEAIPGPVRRLLHQRAGETLAQLGAAAATVARHFREAGNTQRWLYHAEQAADLALSVGDQATSASLLAGLVIGAGPAPGEMARVMDKIVLLALPEESQLSGLAAALRGTLDAGGLAAGEEAGLRFQLGRLLLTMNETDASRGELERAVTGLPPGSLQAARAMMLLGWPHGSDRSAGEHLGWLGRAEATAGDVPPLERLRLAIDRVSALLLLGEEAGWAQAAAIPWEPRAPDENLQVTRAHGNIGEAALLWGRYTDARRRLEHAAELADRFGYTHLQEYGALNLAHLDWLTGVWPGLAERAAALAADSGLRAAARLDAALIGGLLAAASGDTQHAVELLVRSTVGLRQRGDLQYLMEPSAALARIHLAAGEAAEALRVTDEPIALVARKQTWLWAADLVPTRVAALAAAGLTDDAASLADAFARGVRGRSAPAAKAGLTLCQAILADSRGEYATAAALFGRAAAAWQDLPRPYDALLAGEQQARCLLRCGQRETGVQLLLETADGLRRLGAPGDATRADQVLAECGVGPETRETLGAPGAGSRKRPARGRPSYGDRLSPREREVVRLVAQGQTNQEIALTLVLSRQTVAGHVQSAMRKLRVSSRTALAVTAVEADLL
ncbi:MAG: AAA family ATPase [Actinobacteria bacterium]|nr:AAA family ATPase [Actinomycetota bacterium]